MTIRHPTPKTDDQSTVSRKGVHVTGRILVGNPATILPMPGAASGEFTRESFEGALDKVNRPTGRGKLAHLRPNSEEFARRKQEEIDLEERTR